jgi:hypothetical protein
MIRKPLVIPDLPPLWDTPAPYRSTRNGGPPLEPRSAGRPTIDTPELRDRIFELLCDGMPLRAGSETTRNSTGTVVAWF